MTCASFIWAVLFCHWISTQNINTWKDILKNQILPFWYIFIYIFAYFGNQILFPLIFHAWRNISHQTHYYIFEPENLNIHIFPTNVSFPFHNNCSRKNLFFFFVQLLYIDSKHNKCYSVFLLLFVIRSILSIELLLLIKFHWIVLLVELFPKMVEPNKESFWKL